MPYAKPAAALSVTYGGTTRTIEVRIEHYAPRFFEQRIGYFAYVPDTLRGGIISEAWRPTMRWARKVAFRRALAALFLPKRVTAVPEVTKTTSTTR